ncbi:nitrate/nitrite transporter [Devosia sp. Leaf64]|uniref:MFS transporter n=1 Tax=Devosia sp. Leaf64 TaxID=1736229 RepID=UPI000712BCCA|nr:nitrate/nitrite transporter [Devosia sp. Leaf64]KQN72650.1 MFS transporter [Devosia sp. Leaf64]
MTNMQSTSSAQSKRVLTMSTVAFTVCFAVWTIFSIIGVQLKDQLGLSETQFGLLIGTPVLTGSLVRVLLGVLTDRMGGRIVYVITMLAAALATFLLTFAQTYEQFLIAALGVGLAGGSFAVGVAYVSRFYAAGKQGTALGIFGVGNVGSSVTKFLAPFVMLAWGWQSVALIWAAALVVIAVVFWFTTEDDPIIVKRRTESYTPKSLLSEFEPLRNLQVWRFALYYFFAFGAFVALTLWLPRYLIGVYGFDIKTAGMIAAFYSVPASVFRAYGGTLSDRIGARTVLYWTFGVSLLMTAILALPTSDFVVAGINGPVPLHFELSPWAFVGLVFVLGFFMSLGKAAVYKHIPAYYPQNVGAVGGLVGMIGGLGGFVLPLLFGYLNDVTGIWSSCFIALFVLVAVAFLWMHMTVRRIERQPVGQPA